LLRDHDIYFNNATIIKAFIDNIEQLEPHMDSEFCVSIYPQLDNFDKPKMHDVLINNLESKNCMKSACALHDMIQRGTLSDPTVQNKVVEWDIQNIEKIDKDSLVSARLAGAIFKMSPDNKDKLYSTISAMAESKNILPYMIREIRGYAGCSQDDVLKVLTIAYEKMSSNPNITVECLQGNGPRMAHLFGDSTSHQTQELVTKFAAMENVPFEKLSFTRNQEEMRAIYRAEQERYSQIKARQIAQPVKELIASAATNTVVPRAASPETSKGPMRT